MTRDLYNKFVDSKRKKNMNKILTDTKTKSQWF